MSRRLSAPIASASSLPLDARTDLFSFGAVLYAMATGVQPFRGETTDKIHDSILNLTPPSPRIRNPNLSVKLEAIIFSDPVTNIWEQPLNGGPPRQLTNFPSGRIFDFNFNWSRDGKRLLMARRGQQRRGAPQSPALNYSCN